MKKLQLNFWHGLLIMGIIAIVLQVKSCSSDRRYNKDMQTVLSYIQNDSVKTYNAKDGTTVEFNNALKIQFDAFLEAQSDSVKTYLKNIRIPKPDVITVYNDRVYIDSIPQVGLNIQGCEFDTTFNITDPWYEVSGRLSNKALKLESIMIPNKTTFVIGDRKEKWYKKSEYVVTVNNSNPHIQSEGLQSYTFKENRSRWSIGPSIGYGFYYDPWKGNAGHGVTGSISLNYRIIGTKKK